MEYKILQSFSVEGITAQVNDYIKEGWQPLGGICSGLYADHSSISGQRRETPIFYQAMTRIEVMHHLHEMIG